MEIKISSNYTGAYRVLRWFRRDVPAGAPLGMANRAGAEPFDSEMGFSGRVSSWLSTTAETKRTSLNIAAARRVTEVQLTEDRQMVRS